MAKYYGRMTEEGLLQFGYSKDHRPDLVQLKVNLSVLDPLRLPLTATAVSSHCNASCTARIVARDLLALGSAFFKTTAQNDIILDLV